MDISLWRNQDQNENQGAHEIELLMTIKNSAEQFLKTGQQKVSLGDLVAHASRKNPAKIQVTTWQTLSKYYIGSWRTMWSSSWKTCTNSTAIMWTLLKSR